MAQPSIPTTITVGPFTYTVSTDRQAMADKMRSERSDLLGHCDRRALTILLDDSQATGQMLDTLLHETLHAITDLVGLADEWDDEREEAVVRRLSPALLELLRSNPTLVAYLTA